MSKADEKKGQWGLVFPGSFDLTFHTTPRRESIMDEQKKLLQGLWRKAFGQDEPLEVPCKTESNATRLRFSLYNAVREVRTGKAKVDEALKLAVENCSIGFHPEDKTRLVIQRKVMTDLMQTIAGLVEDSPELLKSEEDMAVEASQVLLLQKLSTPDSGLPAADLGLPRVTPYYTREK